MTVQEYIDAAVTAGTPKTAAVTALALLLDVTPGSVWKWYSGNNIPRGTVTRLLTIWATLPPAARRAFPFCPEHEKNPAPTP